MKAHRIQLDVFEGLEGHYVDVHDRRTFGVRSRVLDAGRTQSLFAYNVTRMLLYVSAWSLDGDPSTEAAIEAMDDDVATYVLAQAEEHYEENRRTPAARKSAAGEVGGGLRPAGVLAGYGPEGNGIAV